MSPKMDLFHQAAQQWVIVQPTVVNQALCWNQKREGHVFVIILETGLALCQSAEVCTYYK